MSTDVRERPEFAVGPVETFEPGKFVIFQAGRHFGRGDTAQDRRVEGDAQLVPAQGRADLPGHRRWHLAALPTGGADLRPGGRGAGLPLAWALNMI